MTSSRNIPVRMPEDLYQEIIKNKPVELKVSTYLLLLLRKGLNAGGEVLSPAVDSSVQNVDNTGSSALIASLQSRIAGLEEQLEAMQNIVNEARSIREEAVQQAIDDCLQTVDTRIQTRIQEVVNKEMSELMGGAIA